MSATSLPLIERRAALPWATTALSVVITLLAWELLARSLIGTFLLAGPWDVATYLHGNAGLIGRALAVTIQEAAWGFLFGNLAAVALALIAHMLPRTEKLVSALALLFFCLPLVATGPILRVLYGPGMGPQITLAALAVYYTTYLSVMVGLRAVPSNWVDLVRSYGRGSTTELVRVRARAALPYLIGGLQIAAPAAFLGAMVGEFTGAERGMGVLAIRAMRELDVQATWTLACVASAVSMAAYWLFGWIGRRLSVAPPALILSSPDPRKTHRTYGLGFLRSLAMLALIAVLVLIAWRGLMDLFDLSVFFAKRPEDVWRFLVTDPDAATNRTVLFGALGETLVFTLPGYLVGLMLGAGLAACIMLLPSLSATVLPIAIALRSIPIVTTAPLIVLALGRGAAGMVTIVAIMIFFPTLVACLQGMRQAPAEVLDIFDSYAASRWQRLKLAQVPAMLPAFFAAARMAVPAAFLAVTTAEWLGTGTGIGGLMAMTASTSAYGMLWSGVAALSLLACAAYVAVEFIERAVLSRYASEQIVR